MLRTSIDKALILIETVASSKSASLTQLAETLDIPHSSVYRWLKTLCARGFLEKEADTKGYRVGPRLLELGSLYLAENPLVRASASAMEELGKLTNEAVHLAILDAGRAVYLDIRQPNREVGLVSRVGGGKPAHCCATGKVLLAFASPQTVEEAVEAIDLKAFTENTITTREALARELELIHQRGYALDLGEHSKDIRGVAAPVRNRLGEVVAALSVAGPTYRLSDKTLADLAERVIAAADRVSERLGYVRRG